jgi:hypothetical protein
MRTNTTKAKLAEGKVVFGAIIIRYAPDLVELFGCLAPLSFAPSQQRGDFLLQQGLDQLLDFPPAPILPSGPKLSLTGPGLVCLAPTSRGGESLLPRVTCLTGRILAAFAYLHTFR